MWWVLKAALADGPFYTHSLILVQLLQGVQQLRPSAIL
jgi:hypothetical protein